MTITKTQLADAYSAALTEELGEEWGCEFSRRDANRMLNALWPVCESGPNGVGIRARGPIRSPRRAD